MREKLRTWFRKWLGVDSCDVRLTALEYLLLHTDSRLNGFAVLKKHLNRPDQPLPYFGGKPIEQD